MRLTALLKQQIRKNIVTCQLMCYEGYDDISIYLA
jgi:hypothetical protein